MSLAVRNYSDITYRVAYRQAVACAAAEVAYGRCAAGCGVLTDDVVCERPDCLWAVAPLDWPDVRMLHTLWLERRRLERREAPSLLADLLHVGGALAGLVATVAAFAIVVWPVVRWLVGK